MKDKNQLSLFLLALVLMATLASGCGSNDSSSPSDSGETEASAEFVSPGAGKKQTAKFGEEASSEEREEASSVLEENFDARAAGDWSAQCTSLSTATIRKVEAEGAGLGFKGDCAKQLKALAEPLSETKKIRANTMTGPIAALRVKGDKAFALFHGTKGVDYAIPMSKDGDEWKVDSLVTQEVP